MPPIQCYIDGCEFETPDMGEALAAVMLNPHSEFEWGREDVVRPEILDCCDPAPRQRPLEMVGPDMLNTRTEKELKAQIREISEIAVL